MKIYEVELDNSVVYAISLVDDPAIEENFINLSKDKKQPILLMDSEKHMIYGAVLKPDFPIYRYDEERGEYYIRFSRPTIEKLSQEFMKMTDKRMTLDHEKDTQGVDVVESWIKEDLERDKSVALGLGDLPVGTWFIGCKVNDVDVWDSIKNGERKGFSIESLCMLNEVNFEKMKENEKFESVVSSENFWDKMKQILAEAVGKPSNEEPSIEEVVEAEKVEETVVEEPLEKVEEPKVEEEQVDVKQNQIDELTKENNSLKEQIEAQKQELEKIKNDNESLKAENEKLSKQPSTEPIKVDASKNNKSNFLDFAKGIYNI